MGPMMTLPIIIQAFKNVFKGLYIFWTDCFWNDHDWTDESKFDCVCNKCGSRRNVCPY